ncbi:MAG TPA: DUF177 domain-containing protein, partial [Candidatus Limiplasma sp.]|nr:DUF177 domain-containing protein [Candidatus Limiplasma sp.]
MKLDVTQALLRPGEAFPFEEKVSVPKQDVDSEPVTFDDVLITGTYSAMDGAVWLKGSLRTTAHAPCAMCLKPVDYPMELDFREVFRKDAVETEDEAFSFDGNAVSLDQMTLTLLMLNLPMRFLCRENCEGGETLKQYTASTKSSCQEDTQRPFEALKRLL